MDSYFEYHHTVGFEETNLVGNVYYVNYLRWQGRCREMFLKRHCPEVLADIQAGLKLFTMSVSCEFVAEITAFDELAIRMRLAELTQTQIELTFDYLKLAGDGELLVARGRQRVACMSRRSGQTSPARVPEPLARSLQAYRTADASRRPAVGTRPGGG